MKRERERAYCRMVWYSVDALRLLCYDVSDEQVGVVREREVQQGNGRSKTRDRALLLRQVGDHLLGLEDERRFGAFFDQL